MLMRDSAGDQGSPTVDQPLHARARWFKASPPPARGTDRRYPIRALPDPSHFTLYTRCKSRTHSATSDRLGSSPSFSTPYMSGPPLGLQAGHPARTPMSVARRRPALPPAAEKRAQSARAWPGPIPKPGDRRSALRVDEAQEYVLFSIMASREE